MKKKKRVKRHTESVNEWMKEKSGSFTDAKSTYKLTHTHIKGKSVCLEEKFYTHSNERHRSCFIFNKDHSYHHHIHTLNIADRPTDYSGCMHQWK